MKQETNQERHDLLVDFLNTFKQYDGGLCKFKKSRNFNSYDEIDTNDINIAVAVFADVLNLSQANGPDFSLYKLLQAYFQVPECRSALTKIAHESLLYDNSEIV